MIACTRSLHFSAAVVVAFLAVSAGFLPATFLHSHHASEFTSRLTQGAVKAGQVSGASCPKSNATNSEGLFVQGDKCRPEFNASYTNRSTVVNMTFGVSQFAEVLPSGLAVALADYQNAVWLGTSLNTTSTGSTFSMKFGTMVTNGSGEWSPADTSYGSGTQRLHQGSQVLGTATLALSFHLLRSRTYATSVKFDLNETGWPWVNPSDSLGVELDTFAPPDSSLSFAASTSNLTESTTSGNSQEAALVLGASASVSSGGSGSLTVSTQAGIFSVGGQNDVAALLLTFSGPGGYAGLSYDPWVIFHPSPGSIPVSPPLSMTTWLAIIAVVAIAVVMGAFGLYVRRKPIEEGLSPVADGGRRTRAWT